MHSLTLCLALDLTPKATAWCYEFARADEERLIAWHDVRLGD